MTELKNINIEQQKLWNAINIIEKNRCPSLFISYEKILQEPEKKIMEIANFVGIDIDDTQIKMLKSSMDQGRESYRYRHNTNRLEGEYCILDNKTIGLKLKRFTKNAPRIRADIEIQSLLLGKENKIFEPLSQRILHQDNNRTLRMEVNLRVDEISEEQKLFSDSIGAITTDGFARLYKSKSEDWPKNEL